VLESSQVTRPSAHDHQEQQPAELHVVHDRVAVRPQPDVHDAGGDGDDRSEPELCHRARLDQIDHRGEQQLSHLRQHRTHMNNMNRNMT
jgi:hypothetical protein